MSRAKTSKITEIISISVTPFTGKSNHPLTTAIIPYVPDGVNKIIAYIANFRPFRLMKIVQKIL